MSKFFMWSGFILAGAVWLWTSFLALVNFGLIAALIAFFFPPADLFLMFILGTWPAGVLAVILVVLGGLTNKENSES